ncbi:MAG: bifunctional riboflavin kinase/FMN adenylyltransferase, partial [Gammaproteobacteria bacterium]|nr:bifunctional riboflavin kinase/FMN adenylyltransferase [Gammaproteobacteria bacterium]NIO88174.1 bifunctional riboflavin kinase/FMN adenylyltransferase [Candidatus Aminicenantes bacterium]
FEPQPQEFFRPEHAPARLMRMREKIEGLDKEGIDRLVCLRFNASLASLSAETFVKEILVEGIAVRHLVVGDDFRFGKDRLGDFSLLQRLGKQNGFDVIGTVTQEINGRR